MEIEKQFEDVRKVINCMVIDVHIYLNLIYIAGPRRDPCLERRSYTDISICEMCDHHLVSWYLMKYLKEKV